MCVVSVTNKQTYHQNETLRIEFSLLFFFSENVICTNLLFGLERTDVVDPDSTEASVAGIEKLLF